MIKTEFGIIDEIDANKDYGHYEPEKYNCIYIDDDIGLVDQIQSWMVAPQPAGRA